MNIEELTLKQLHELLSITSSAVPFSSSSPWKIGQNYLIRTVTMIDTGRLVAVTEHELVLEDAAWIAATGRFADAIKSSEFDEVEPYPDGALIVGRSAVIDAVQIPSLPRTQK